MGDYIASSPADEVFPASDIPLFAGDTPAPVTRDVLFPAALPAIGKYVPLSFAAGAYKVWAAGEQIVAITAYAVPDKASDQRAAVYTAGMFNIDAINWPAGTTEAQVEAGAANSQCQFKKRLYSDKRVTQSVTAVGPGNEAPVKG